MAIIKKKEIKSMEKNELSKKMEELRYELIKVRSQKATQGGPKKIKEIKKTIARINTQLNKIQPKKTNTQR